jgi:hypothetical protein
MKTYIKPLFKVGQVINTPHETIEILKVYPAGHKYANDNSNFYLINSSDIGQDTVPENILKSLNK